MHALSDLLDRFVKGMHRLTNGASDAELWYFLWCQPEYDIEQTFESPVIRDAVTFLRTHWNGIAKLDDKQC